MVPVAVRQGTRRIEQFQRSPHNLSKKQYIYRILFRVVLENDIL